MGRKIEVTRLALSASKLRRLASRSQDGRVACRALAIAPVLEGSSLNAAVAVLKGLRPPGRAIAAGGDAKSAEAMNVLMRTSNSNSWGESYGKSVLDVLRGKESVVSSTGWIERVKELLGPVGERVSKDGD